MIYNAFTMFSLWTQANPHVFKFVIIWYGLLIMKEEVYHLKHEVVELHDLMIKSLLNAWFLYLVIESKLWTLKRQSMSLCMILRNLRKC